MTAGSRTSSRRSLIAVFCGLLLLGAAALAVAGVSDQRATAFSVDVPPSAQVAIVSPGQTVCQSPVSVPSPAAGMTVWVPGGTLRGTGFLATVRNADTHAVLAQAELLSRSASSASRAPLAGTLSHRLKAPQRVSICLRSTSRGVVDLLGSASGASSGTLTLSGKHSNLALSMVFTAPRSRSLLAMLPTVFGRAVLFHPRWMGAWTFWALLVGLVIAAALALASLLAAAAADECAPGEPAPGPNAGVAPTSPRGIQRSGD